jgi:hypothetical protein
MKKKFFFFERKAHQTKIPRLRASTLRESYVIIMNGFMIMTLVLVYIWTYSEIWLGPSIHPPNGVTRLWCDRNPSSDDG